MSDHTGTRTLRPLVFLLSLLSFTFRCHLSVPSPRNLGWALPPSLLMPVAPSVWYRRSSGQDFSQSATHTQIYRSHSEPIARSATQGRIPKERHICC
jgi:hypothetical protein